MSVKLSLWLVFLLVACGSGQVTSGPGSTAAGSTAAGLQRGTATAADGVTPLELTCHDGADERCDALDDDCDGRIDEGCGYGDGVLSIVATWGDEADLDLVVTSQAADDLPTPSTHSGRGGCAPEAAHPRIESASWSAPIEGEIGISLTHADACDANEDDAADDAEPRATVGSVSIAFGGETVGTFNVSVEPGSTAEVATLSLTR